jgi:hypothetical protein
MQLYTEIQTAIFRLMNTNNANLLNKISVRIWSSLNNFVDRPLWRDSLDITFRYIAIKIPISESCQRLLQMIFVILKTHKKEHV